MVSVLEQWHVSPAPAPAAEQPRVLPLTFFDLVFWGFPPVQRLFLFDNVDVDVPGFLLGELPALKESLSAALHHWYPLAGKLVGGTADGDAAPELVFTDGDSSVRLTVAASGDDFRELAGDDPRDVARLRPLLPPLPGDGGVLAVQAWAAIHRRRSASDDEDLPLLDRTVVRDDDGKLLQAFIRDHRTLGDWDLSSSRHPDGVVLGTFRFPKKLLDRLERHVESETSVRHHERLDFPWTLSCAVTWVGILHARSTTTTAAAANNNSSATAYFGYVSGCKPRMRPPIPANYFGNCIGLGCVEVQRSGLTVATASAAIERVSEELAGEQGYRMLRDARGWVRRVREYAAERAVTVAGSPKLGVYAVEFGAPWGRPRKVEMPSVERTGALSIAEGGRDGDGGMEIGLALPRPEMDKFQAFYRHLCASVGFVPE
ncbi:hypothetical protein EJB05_57911, partial [Eragrostis curvula]